MRSGSRGGTGPWGQYKTPGNGMLGYIRAERAFESIFLKFDISDTNLDVVFFYFPTFPFNPNSILGAKKNLIC